MHVQRRILEVVVLVAALGATTIGCVWPPAHAPLEGVQWRLEETPGIPPPAPGTPLVDTLIYATFRPASFGPQAGMTTGSVTGSAGCNDYGGTYERQANRLTIREIASTLKLCTDPVVMERERIFTERLPRTASFRIEPVFGGSHLTLSDATGQTLLVLSSIPIR